MASVQDPELYAHARNIKGKVLLITGAANGIGKAIALDYARHGASVVIGDIDVANALAVAKEVETLGSKAVSQKCDVTSWEDQVSLFLLAISTFGRVDIVIPNAGVAEIGRFNFAESFSGPPTKPNLKTLEVNLIGVLYTTRLALHYLPQSSTPGKALIFIGSIASITGLPFAPLYVASKHSIVGLARTLYSDVHPKIRIGVVCPWFADTDIVATPARILLAGLPFASMSRISGAAVLAASDPNPDTNGSLYTIPDDGLVFRIPREELNGGIYKVLSERVGTLITMKNRAESSIAVARSLCGVFGMKLAVFVAMTAALSVALIRWF